MCGIKRQYLCSAALLLNTVKALMALLCQTTLNFTTLFGQYEKPLTQV